MNKVININLGGYAFAIDADAYEVLFGYLNVIRAHFRSSEGYEEITGDIEARLAELFRESMGNREIVTLSDVHAGIEIMGTPEDFGVEADGLDVGDHSEPIAGERKWKPGKRLFRDEEKGILGGVAAGLSAYLGIENPLWMRILFVLLIIGGGLGIILYPLFWVLVPPARTAAERLAMRGEKIDVNSIGATVESDLRRLGRRVNETLNDQERLERAGNNFGAKVERGALKTVRWVARMFRHNGLVGRLLSVLILLLLIAGALFWIATVLAFFLGSDVLSYLLPEHSFALGSGIGGVLLMAMVPLLIFGMLFLRQNLQYRFHGAWWGLPVAALFTGLLFFGIGAGTYASELQQSITVEDLIVEAVPPEDALRIELSRDFYRNSKFNLDGIAFGDNEFVIDHKSIVLQRSPDSLLRVTLTRRAAGRNMARAEEVAERIEFPVTMNGSVLTIAEYFAIPKGTPFTGQRVSVQIELPDGTDITMGDRTVEWLNNWKSHLSEAIDNRRYRRLEEGQIYTMLPNGLHPGTGTLSKAE